MEAEKEEKIVYFDDEDFCSTELQPIENFDFIRQKLAETDFYARSRELFGKAEYGVFGEDSDPPADLSDYKITLTDFENLLHDMKKFDKVCDMSGDEDWFRTDMAAWAFGSVTVLVSVFKDFIDSIWFLYFPDRIEVADELYALLKRITSVYDLVFVDWELMKFCSHVQKDSFLQIALQDKIEPLVAFYETMEDDLEGP